ncbi:MAG TPA: hypothetical protein VK188_07400 [Holophaga sp.]|nr:hypothetical protein [Holophaga sp.]
MLRILALLLLPLLAWGGSKEVVLKDGQRYRVSTSFGRPVQPSNSFFTVKHVRPAIQRMDGWRKQHVFWEIQLEIVKPFEGFLEVDSPLVQGGKYVFPVEDGPDRLYVHYLRVDVMEREGTPAMWEWIDEPGESWIPFRLTSISRAGDFHRESLVWAKVDESDKKKARQDLERFKDRMDNPPTLDAVSITGEKIRLTLEGNGPLRHEDLALRVDDIAPGVLGGASPSHPGELAFCLNGRHRSPSETEVTITAPWGGTFSAKARIRMWGDFQIPFGLIGTDPGLWRWLDAEGEFWIPFTIRVRNASLGEDQVFLEWFRVTPAIRAELRKLRPGPPAP